MSRGTTHPTRRQLLHAAALTAGALAGTGALTACSTDDGSGQDTAERNTAVKLPAYVPYRGVTPDLPGDQKGLLNAFVRYPAQPRRALPGTPLDGGSFSAFVPTSSPVPPGRARNSYWQRLEDRLGADLKLTIVPSADLSTKFATLIAGDDLPDFLVPPGPPLQGVKGLPRFLAAKCQDLTEYLSGDAVREYPFLANLPTAAWRACVYNGGIYGLPVARGVAGNLLFRRDDLFASLGANPDPADFEEFRETCAEITDAKRGRWALTTPHSALNFVQQMLGLPNKWRLDKGRLTHLYEHEEVQQALEDARRMYKDGLIHPDSMDANAPWKQWFNNGSALLTEDRYTAWPQYHADNVAGESFAIGGMRPPRYDGGGLAGTWQSPPVNNVTALKKADPDRIRELLKAANWLAAPFGTEEYLFRRYGVEGTHYEMRGGGPVQTQAGLAQTVLGIRYITDAPDTLYVPGKARATREMYAYQKSVIPTSVQDPTVALYSETFNRTGAVLDQRIRVDAANDIISGRKPVSSWEQAVREWRDGGGDAMRGEYEAQL